MFLRSLEVGALHRPEMFHADRIKNKVYTKAVPSDARLYGGKKTTDVIGTQGILASP